MFVRNLLKDLKFQKGRFLRIVYNLFLKLMTAVPFDNCPVKAREVMNGRFGEPVLVWFPPFSELLEFP